jgi:hypothetical protein
MLNRITHSLGSVADTSVIAAVLTIPALSFMGITYSEMATILGGTGAFFIGFGRFIKYCADSYLAFQNARQVSTYTKKEVWEMLESYKCLNAKNCPTRRILKDEGEV